jgi:iron complex transport system substrate-binding protein
MPRFNRRHIIIAIAISFFLLSKSASAEGPKRRIVSLTPASTEILFALGLDEEIVGVSSFCNWPAEASEKEKIGSFSSPDIEKIILLKPDLVILTGMEQEYFKTTLHSLRIDYIIVDPPDLEELFVSIAKIADATGKNKEADILIKGIKEQIYKIKKRLSNISDQDRPKVYLEIWHDPIMSAGRDSFVNDMIEKAGGVNITSGLGRSFSRVDPE